MAVVDGPTDTTSAWGNKPPPFQIQRPPWQASLPGAFEIITSLPKSMCTGAPGSEKTHAQESRNGGVFAETKCNKELRGDARCGLTVLRPPEHESADVAANTQC